MSALTGTWQYPTNCTNSWHWYKSSLGPWNWRNRWNLMWWFSLSDLEGGYLVVVRPRVWALCAVCGWNLVIRRVYWGTIYDNDAFSAHFDHVSSVEAAGNVDTFESRFLTSSIFRCFDFSARFFFEMKKAFKLHEMTKLMHETALIRRKKLIPIIFMPFDPSETSFSIRNSTKIEIQQALDHN